MSGIKVRAIRPSTNSWLEVDVPADIANNFLMTQDLYNISQWVGNTFGWQFIPMELVYGNVGELDKKKKR